MKSPLSAIGSYDRGGRYNAARTFEVFYAAAQRDATQRETRAIIVDPATGAIISTPRPPAIDLTITVVLQKVVDLTDPATCNALAIKPSDLLLEWRHLLAGDKRIPTHIVGCAAFEAGLEALVVPSARLRGTTNIAIFVANLRIGSSIEIYEPHGFPDNVTVKIEGSV